MIRLLGEDDAAAYRDLRLEALRLHPGAFGASYEQEAAQDLAFFGNRVTTNAIFGGFCSGERLLGCAGLMIQPGLKRVHKGVLWGVYARPEARGSGLARRLVSAVLAHAHGLVELVQLSVVAENASARGLYASLGFVAYGVEARSLKVDGRYFDEVLMVKMPV